MRSKKRQAKTKNRFHFRVTSDTFVYLRVSTDEQATNAYGLESQEYVCRCFCEERGWIVVRVFCDAGVSGWSKVGRPQFHEMFRQIRLNPKVNLVFLDFSRFYRDTRRALEAFDELDCLGVMSMSASNPSIDCRTADGRTARRRLLSEAEDFSDQLSEKQQLRMKHAVLSGRWIAQSPLGYQNVRTKTKGEPNIAPAEPGASWMKQSFSLMGEGTDRPAAVLRKMADLGMRSKNGKIITVDRFINMLRNVAYIGQIPSKKYGNQKGLHVPLVSEALFRRVQLILKGKKPVSAPIQRNRPELPLRRFLQCAHCGTPLTGGRSTGQSGKRYFHYYCPKCHEGKCMRVSVAEERFLDVLARLQPSAAFTEEFIPFLRDEWEKTSGDSALIARNLEKELKTVEAQDHNLMQKYISNDPVIMPYFDDFKRQYAERITSLKERIDEANSARATFDELLAFSKAILVDVATAWKHADLDQRQRVQTALFPGGLKYDREKGILNPANDSVFSQLENFLAGNTGMVGLLGLELNCDLLLPARRCLCDAR